MAAEPTLPINPLMRVLHSSTVQALQSTSSEEFERYFSEKLAEIKNLTLPLLDPRDPFSSLCSSVTPSTNFLPLSFPTDSETREKYSFAETIHHQGRKYAKGPYLVQRNTDGKYEARVFEPAFLYNYFHRQHPDSKTSLLKPEGLALWDSFPFASFLSKEDLVLGASSHRSKMFAVKEHAAEMQATLNQWKQAEENITAQYQSLLSGESSETAVLSFLRNLHAYYQQIPFFQERLTALSVDSDDYLKKIDDFVKEAEKDAAERAERAEQAKKAMPRILCRGGEYPAPTSTTRGSGPSAAFNFSSGTTEICDGEASAGKRNLSEMLDANLQDHYQRLQRVAPSSPSMREYFERLLPLHQALINAQKDQKQLLLPHPSLKAHFHPSYLKLLYSTIPFSSQEVKEATATYMSERGKQCSWLPRTWEDPQKGYHQVACGFITDAQVNIVDGLAKKGYALPIFTEGTLFSRDSTTTSPQNITIFTETGPKILAEVMRDPNRYLTNFVTGKAVRFKGSLLSPEEEGGKALEAEVRVFATPGLSTHESEDTTTEIYRTRYPYHPPYPDNKHSQYLELFVMDKAPFISCAILENGKENAVGPIVDGELKPCAIHHRAPPVSLVDLWAEFARVCGEHQNSFRAFLNSRFSPDEAQKLWEKALPSTGSSEEPAANFPPSNILSSILIPVLKTTHEGHTVYERVKNLPAMQGFSRLLSVQVEDRFIQKIGDFLDEAATLKEMKEEVVAADAELHKELGEICSRSLEGSGDIEPSPAQRILPLLHRAQITRQQHDACIEKLKAVPAELAQYNARNAALLVKKSGEALNNTVTEYCQAPLRSAATGTVVARLSRGIYREADNKERIRAFKQFYDELRQANLDEMFYEKALDFRITLESDENRQFRRALSAASVTPQNIGNFVLVQTVIQTLEQVLDAQGATFGEFRHAMSAWREPPRVPRALPAVPVVSQLPRALPAVPVVSRLPRALPTIPQAFGEEDIPSGLVDVPVPLAALSAAERAVTISSGLPSEEEMRTLVASFKTNPAQSITKKLAQALYLELTTTPEGIAFLENPEHALRCCINLEKMEHPVVLNSKLYEEEVIKHWLKNSVKDPCTNLQASTRDLTDGWPNICEQFTTHREKIKSILVSPAQDACIDVPVASQNQVFRGGDATGGDRAKQMMNAHLKYFEKALSEINHFGADGAEMTKFLLEQKKNAEEKQDLHALKITIRSAHEFLIKLKQEQKQKEERKRKQEREREREREREQFYARLGVPRSADGFFGIQGSLDTRATTSFPHASFGGSFLPPRAQAWGTDVVYGGSQPAPAATPKQAPSGFSPGRW